MNESTIDTISNREQLIDQLVTETEFPTCQLVEKLQTVVILVYHGRLFRFMEDLAMFVYGHEKCTTIACITKHVNTWADEKLSTIRGASTFH